MQPCKCFAIQVGLTTKNASLSCSPQLHMAAMCFIRPPPPQLLLIDPPPPPTSSSSSVTAIDVNTSTNHPLPLPSIKQLHSPTISKSDKVSLAIPAAFLPSDITSITTAISTSEQPAKKKLRSSQYLGVSAKDIVSPARKTTPAGAVIGMQGSINWLTDIFERSMMSHLAKDLPLPLKVM